MLRTKLLLTGLLLVALILSACQPIQRLVPRAAQPSSESVSGFVENDGVRIHYEAEGQGPPLVLLHSWTGSLENWRIFGYVDALKSNYRLILIDARGHGQSDKPYEEAAYALPQQVGDVVAVLDELGIEKTHFFGYSMGGTIGWALAKYAPERLLSLIVGGEAPESYDPVDDIAGIRSLGVEGWGQMAGDLLSSYGFPQAAATNLEKVYGANDLDAVIADIAAFSAEDFAADLPMMTMPILLLAGTEDSDHDAMAATVQKLPEAHFVSLNGFDHVGAMVQTKLIVEQINQFLAKP